MRTVALMKQGTSGNTPTYRIWGLANDHIHSILAVTFSVKYLYAKKEKF